MGKLIIKNRYGTIPNDLLNSVDISFKAKGLYAYIQSKPDNWEFSAERIAKQVKEGLPSVVSALKELENFGYLVRKRYQNSKGFWVVDYLLYEIPNEENLYAGNPMQENPNIGKPSNISNIDFSKQEVINYTNKKEREVTLVPDFEFFWDIYNKKIDRFKCEKAWGKLNQLERDKIIETVRDYVKFNSEIKFRKNPLTYLNGKSFNDEIPDYSKKEFNPEPPIGKMTKGLLQQQEIYNELLEQLENGTYVNPFDISKR